MGISACCWLHNFDTFWARCSKYVTYLSLLQSLVVANRRQSFQPVFADSLSEPTVAEQMAEIIEQDFIFVFWALIAVFSSCLWSALKDHILGKTVIEIYDSASSVQNQPTRLLHVRQAA